MSVVGDLLVRLKADTSGFTASMEKASTQVLKLSKSFAGITGTALAKMRSEFSVLSSTIAKFVGPLVAAGTAFASFAAVMKSFRQSEDLIKVSDTLGVTTDALQKLHYAANTTGGSAEAMDSALTKLSQNLRGLEDPASSASKSLKSIGLSAEDLKGLSADEAFVRIADALSKTSDQGVRSKATMDLLGRSARDLGSVIKGGAEGIKASGDEAERLGVVLSKLDLAKMSGANDAMDRLTQVVGSLSDKLAVKLAPMIAFVSDELVRAAKEGSSLMGVVDGFINAILVGIGVIKMVVQGVQVLWETLKVGIASVEVGFWEATRGITKAWLWTTGTIGNSWDVCVAGVSVAISGLIKMYYYMKEKVATVFADMAEAFGKMIFDMGRAAEASGLDILEDVANSAQNAGAEMVIGARKMKEGVKNELEAASESMRMQRETLVKARAAFDKGPDTETKKLDEYARKAHNWLTQTVSDLQKLSDEIKSQKGGNAISQVFADYNKALSKFNSDAEEKAEDLGQKRSVIDDKSLNQFQKYLDEKDIREKAFYFNTWKRVVDANEAISNAQKYSNEVNVAMMAEVDKAHAEFIAQKEAREYAYFDSIKMRSEQSNEQLLLAKKYYEEEVKAMTDEYRARYEMEEMQGQQRLTAMWESGAKGKIQVISEFAGQVTSIMNSFLSMMDQNNRKQFEMWKKLAIAVAVIETARAVISGFSQGMQSGSIYAAIAYAAAAAAAGAAQIAKIAKTKYGGGGDAGGTPSIGSAGGAGQGQQSQTTTNVNVTLVGDSYNQKQVRALMGQINEAAGDNVRINTAA